MGKFKELAIEIQEIKRNQHMRQLIAKYPSIAGFITECFLNGEEDKVYKLIIAFKEETCGKPLH